MEQIDVLLKNLQKEKDKIHSKKQLFLMKYEQAKKVTSDDEEYCAEMKEYVEEKIKNFDIYLQDLEDLEFRIEESKIQTEENLEPVDISKPTECLLQITKRHIFKKHFFWE